MADESALGQPAARQTYYNLKLYLSTCLKPKGRIDGGADLNSMRGE
jgi:hypothetical protein